MMVGADSAEYTDMPIEVVLEDGRVWVRLLSFRRPLRLTPAEGLSLVAAGSALLDVPGADPAGPLGRALAKLADVLGIEPGQALDVDLGAVTGDAFSVLRRAVTGRHQVKIESYTEARRRVDHPGRSIRGECSPSSAVGMSTATAIPRRGSGCSASTGCGQPKCWTRRSIRREGPQATS